MLRHPTGGLRDAGFVVSAKGQGGGWVLSCALDRITLGAVYQALGATPLVSLRFREDRPTCLVARAVNAALAGAAQEARALLLKRFGAVTLATLSADFHHRMAQHKALGHSGHHHLKEHTREEARPGRALGLQRLPLPVLPRRRDERGPHRHHRRVPASAAPRTHAP